MPTLAPRSLPVLAILAAGLSAAPVLAQPTEPYEYAEPALPGTVVFGSEPVIQPLPSAAIDYADPDMMPPLPPVPPLPARPLIAPPLANGAIPPPTSAPPVYAHPPVAYPGGPAPHGYAYPSQPPVVMARHGGWGDPQSECHERDRDRHHGDGLRNDGCAPQVHHLPPGVVEEGYAYAGARNAPAYGYPGYGFGYGYGYGYGAYTLVPVVVAVPQVRVVREIVTEEWVEETTTTAHRPSRPAPHRPAPRRDKRIKLIKGS